MLSSGASVTLRPGMGFLNRGGREVGAYLRLKMNVPARRTDALAERPAPVPFLKRLAKSRVAAFNGTPRPIIARTGLKNKKSCGADTLERCSMAPCLYLS